MQPQLYRIKEIYNQKGFSLFCVFNKGEYRIIDFEKLLKKWRLSPDDPEYSLLDNDKFDTFTLKNGLLCWEEIRVYLIDENRQEQSYPLELDPVVLYENSEIDKDKFIENIGYFIRLDRKEAGLTQAELGEKVGLSPTLISKIENNQSNNIMNIKRIFEKGFHQKLKIEVEKMP